MNDSGLRDALLAKQTVSPELQARYKEEVRTMMEKRLSSVQRIAFSLAAVLGLAFFVGFGIVAWWSMGSLPILASAGFVLGSAFGLAWVFLMVRVLKRGAINLKTDNNLQTGIMWVFIVLMTTSFLMLGSQMADTAKGNQMILVALVFLVMFGVIGMTQNAVQQAELRMREQMLQIQQQLADLAEKTQKSH